MHGSDSPESAAREIELWFPGLNAVEWPDLRGLVGLDRVMWDTGLG